MSFVLGGKTAEELGLVLLKTTDWVFAPETRDRTKAIPGRHGAYYFGADLGPLPIPLDVELIKSTNRQELEEYIRELKAHLFDIYARPKELELRFDNEPDKYYLVHYSGSANIRKLVATGTFTLPFMAYENPFAIGDERIITIDGPNTFFYGPTFPVVVDKYTILNPGSVVAKHRFVVRPKPMRLEDMPGGNYVEYEGTTYLSLTGGNRRVMDLELSASAEWSAHADWPSQAELSYDDWIPEKWVAPAHYWTSTEIDASWAVMVEQLPPNDAAFLAVLKTETHATRLCQTLPEGLYVASGTGTEIDPYILGEEAAVWHPATAWQVEYKDKIMKVEHTLEGDYELELDFTAKTITLNGENILSSKTAESEFFDIEPGEDNIEVGSDGENITEIYLSPRWL